MLPFSHPKHEMFVYIHAYVIIFFTYMSYHMWPDNEVFCIVFYCTKYQNTRQYLPLFTYFVTATRGPGCGEGINLRLCDFVVVPLMPTRELI